MDSILVAVVMAMSIPQAAQKPATETSEYSNGRSIGKMLVYRRTAGKKQKTLQVAVQGVHRPSRFRFPYRNRRGRRTGYVPGKSGYALRVNWRRNWPIWGSALGWRNCWQGYERRGEGMFQNTFYGYPLKPVLVLPNRVRRLMTWENTFKYNGIKVQVTHTVLSVDETVTVEAGTFSCIVIQDVMVFPNGRTRTVIRSFGKGVGLVKEVVHGRISTSLELQEVVTPSWNAGKVN